LKLLEKLVILYRFNIYSKIDTWQLFF